MGYFDVLVRHKRINRERFQQITNARGHGFISRLITHECSHHFPLHFYPIVGVYNSGLWRNALLAPRGWDMECDFASLRIKLGTQNADETLIAMRFTFFEGPYRANSGTIAAIACAGMSRAMPPGAGPPSGTMAWMNFE
jgi:hypothetical protein